MTITTTVICPYSIKIMSYLDTRWEHVLVLCMMFWILICLVHCHHMRLTDTPNSVPITICHLPRSLTICSYSRSVPALQYSICSAVIDLFFFYSWMLEEGIHCLDIELLLSRSSCTSQRSNRFLLYFFPSILCSVCALWMLPKHIILMFSLLDSCWSLFFVCNYT